MTYPNPPGDPYGPPPPDPIQPYQPPAAYGAPPPAYQPPAPYEYGYDSPYSHPGFVQRPPVEGLAIASLVVSCVSVTGLCVYGVGALLGILGAIFGHVARSKMKRNGTSGAGMALAGIIIGWTMTGIALLIGVVAIVAIATDS